MSEPYHSDMMSSDINWEDPFDFDSFLNFSGQVYADEGLEGMFSRFGVKGGEDTVALSPAAKSSRADSGFLNDYALQTSSIADPAVPNLAPSSVESHAQGADQQQLPVEGNGCDCICCAGVGKKLVPPIYTFEQCRVPGCNVPDHDKILNKEILKEEAGHFRIPGEAKFKCAEADCAVAASSMTDLKRHYTNKHCTKSEKFSCPLVWCKYSGDNGFKRKDKLKSHYRNAHEGKRDPSKAFRVTKSNSSGGVSGGMSASASGKMSTPPSSGN